MTNARIGPWARKGVPIALGSGMGGLIVWSVLASASAPPSALPSPSQYVSPTPTPFYQMPLFFALLAVLVLALLLIFLVVLRRRRKDQAAGAPASWSGPTGGEGAGPEGGPESSLLPPERPTVSEDVLATPPTPRPRPPPRSEAPTPEPAPKTEAPEEPSIDDVMKELDRLEDTMKKTKGAAKKPPP